jgi:hypothetical protein
MLASRSDNYKHYLLTAGMCVVALALRVQIANDAFWLDEIWSYYLTGLMESSSDAFTKIRIDNNHLLNTLTMYWFGEQANWTLYRLPAVLSGVATVALMGLAARQLRLAPWLAMLLATVSLPLIQYSAEARGYSSAAMFGLCAWLIYFGHLGKDPTLRWLAAFWVTCVLGLLSHLTFIFVFIALGLTWLSGCLNERKPNLPHIRNGMAVFVVPTLFLTWIYLYFYSQTSAGGGETNLRLAANLLELARYIMGAPRIVPLEIAASLLLLSMMAIGIWRLHNAQRLFFCLATAVIPGLLLTFYQPDFFYPRYLLVCVPFVYLLIAKALSDAFNRPGLVRIVSACIVVVVVCGSAVQYRELATWGKGDYPQAVEDLFNNATGTFTVGSDFDFRNKALLDFYSRYQVDSQRLNYVPLAYEQDAPTDYFFMHNQQPDHKADATIKLKSGIYHLIGRYPYYGLSGWDWYLYSHANIVQPPAD